MNFEESQNYQIKISCFNVPFLCIWWNVENKTFNFINLAINLEQNILNKIRWQLIRFLKRLKLLHTLFTFERTVTYFYRLNIQFRTLQFWLVKLKIALSIYFLLFIHLIIYIFDGQLGAMSHIMCVGMIQNAWCQTSGPTSVHWDSSIWSLIEPVSFNRLICFWHSFVFAFRRSGAKLLSFTTSICERLHLSSGHHRYTFLIELFIIPLLHISYQS